MYKYFGEIECVLYVYVIQDVCKYFRCVHMCLKYVHAYVYTYILVCVYICMCVCARSFITHVCVCVCAFTCLRERA